MNIQMGEKSVRLIINGGNLKLVALQVLVLLALAFFVVLIKKIKFLKTRIKINPLDLWPPFLIVFIHQLSSNGPHGTLVPEVLVVWFAVALGILIWRIFTDQQMNYRKTLILLWRLSDLLLFIAWLVVMVMSLTWR